MKYLILILLIATNGFCDRFSDLPHLDSIRTVNPPFPKENRFFWFEDHDKAMKCLMITESMRSFTPNISAKECQRRDEEATRKTRLLMIKHLSG
ncbi:MAG: hypothetical protein ACTSQA_06015 [Candidatus Heimdallarchaeaceae archaeon]